MREGRKKREREEETEREEGRKLSMCVHTDKQTYKILKNDLFLFPYIHINRKQIYIVHFSYLYLFD